MKHFKEEIIRDIFNDAVVVTTKEHYYYASDSEKKQHKITNYCFYRNSFSYSDSFIKNFY